MTKIIGITGGIGSGKSTLCKYLKKTGYPVHESDKVVSEMYKNPNKSFLDFIKKCGFNEAIINKKINKKLITNKIFDNPALRKKFEKFIHSKVREKRERFIKKNSKTHNKAIFVDIPLLLENNLEVFFDLVLCVISTKKNRVKRVLKNNKFSKRVLLKILKTQKSDKERRKRSNIIINNNGTRKDFIFNAHKALTDILK